ncbi:MAG: hypothetical protein ACFFER_08705 [Candidatus Thorarchaeota archaeon]
MTRLRGRPKKPLPIHPERVISKAIIHGLSASVSLQRAITNTDNEHLYLSTKRAWKIARQVYSLTKQRGKADFSYITKAEAQIRENMWRMMVEKSAEYGFTETARIKSSDDEVGPLNQRFNAGGAALRNFMTDLYHFKDPTSFGTKTKRTGKTRKKFRDAGYKASSYGPELHLVHVDLPQLDFGDSVRSHLEYLEAFCTIHDVSVRDTTRYCNLFLMKVKPYLDHIYSEGRYGKPAFRDGINRELRLIKDDISANYSPQFYTKQTVTGSTERKQPASYSIDFFKDQLKEAKSAGIVHPNLTELEKIITGGFKRTGRKEEPCLTAMDVKHFREKAVKRGRIRGSQIHRRIAALMAQPWRLSNAILGGDEFADEDGYLLVSEVDIDTLTGKGRIDLILLQREMLHESLEVRYAPVFVLEIKTALDQDWTLESSSIFSDSRFHHNMDTRVVAEFHLRDRVMRQNDWESHIRATPSESTIKQIEAYSKAALQTYQDLTDDTSSRGILKGTILVDASSDISSLRGMIKPLIIKVFEHLKNRKRKIQRTVFEPRKQPVGCRVALVVHNQERPRLQTRERLPISWSPAFDPLNRSSETKRRFILYLSSRTRDSGGVSAAWQARYYHGLHLLKELVDSESYEKIIWLDLGDEFNDALLAESRLKLRPYSYAERDVWRTQPDEIRTFFEGIQVIGLFQEMMDHLHGQVESSSLGKIFRESEAHPSIIVVSGWDRIQNATPEPHRSRLTLVMKRILEQLPQDARSTVVWFDSVVPGEGTSVPYSTRTVFPFYGNSPLQEEITEIILNLPVAPRHAVAPNDWLFSNTPNNPMYDDIRVIVKQTPFGFETELVLVPILVGWSKRFRNEGLGLLSRGREIEEKVPNPEIRKRMTALSLTLVPWLVDLWPDSELSVKEEYDSIQREFFLDSKKVSIVSRTLRAKPDPEIGVLKRLRFRPMGVGGGLSHVAVAFGINSQRLYRSPNRVSSSPRQDMKNVTSISNVRKPDETYNGMSYGFTDEDSPWWIVLESSDDSIHALVGSFERTEPNTLGFLWSDQKLGLDSGWTASRIIKLEQQPLFLIKTEHGYDAWLWNSTANEYEALGVFQLIQGEKGTRRRLRAIRILPLNTTSMKPSITHGQNHVQKDFNLVLRRELHQWRSAINVKLLLEVTSNDECKVIFKSSEDEELQELSISTMPDLISLLRWPLQSTPFRTDSGKYIEWDIFNDIEFNNFEMIRPLVETSQPKAKGESFPIRVKDFLHPSEAITVTVTHEKQVCPLLSGSFNHKDCWRIDSKSASSPEIGSLIGGGKTGKQVYRLLSPNRLWADKLYSLDIEFNPEPGETQSIFFQEDNWMRRLLREQGFHLPWIQPGIFLKTESELWVPNLHWKEDLITLAAVSTLTSQNYKGRTYEYRLDFTLTIEEQVGEIMNWIEGILPAGKIADLMNIRNGIRSKLRGYGYGKQPPPCLLLIEQTESGFRINLQLKEKPGMKSIDSLKTPIDSDTHRGRLEQDMEWAYDDKFAPYNIDNVDEFTEKLESIVSEMGLEDRDWDDETSRGWRVAIYADGCAMFWFAESVDDSKQVLGPEVFVDALDWLKDWSIEDFRELCRQDIVNRLRVVENIDEVLNEQIPKALFEIRERC